MGRGNFGAHLRSLIEEFTVYQDLQKFLDGLIYSLVQILTYLSFSIFLHSTFFSLQTSFLGIAFP